MADHYIFSDGKIFNPDNIAYLSCGWHIHGKEKAGDPPTREECLIVHLVLGDQIRVYGESTCKIFIYNLINPDVSDDAEDRTYAWVEQVWDAMKEKLHDH